MLLGFYRTMVRIRSFEEHAAECFTKGMLAGNIHLSIDQEGAEAGAFAAIQPQDYFTSTHRGHGHVIARGGDPKLAMAELFGKRSGYCKGKGGSMHIADMAKMNHLGANGIVGAGATNEGTFHENLNMAAAWKLPVVHRPSKYMEDTLKNDAIEKLGAKLKKLGVTEAELDKIKQDAQEEMDEAVRFADASEYPDPATVLDDMYVTDNERCVAR